jgi:hypothetical protein
MSKGPSEVTFVGPSASRNYKRKKNLRKRKRSSSAVERLKKKQSNLRNVSEA